MFFKTIYKFAKLKKHDNTALFYFEKNDFTQMIP